MDTVKHEVNLATYAAPSMHEQGYLQSQNKQGLSIRDCGRLQNVLQAMPATKVLAQLKIAYLLMKIS